MSKSYIPSDAGYHAASDGPWLQFPMAHCADPFHGEVPPPSHTAVPFIVSNKQTNKTRYCLLTDVFHNTHQCAAQVGMECSSVFPYSSCSC